MQRGGRVRYQGRLDDAADYLAYHGKVMRVVALADRETMNALFERLFREEW